MKVKKFFTPKEFSTILFISIFAILGYSYKIFAESHEGKKQEEKINKLIEHNIENKDNLKTLSQKEKEKNIKKININTADAKELTKINGIGIKKANNIIEYRKEHGKFRNIKELVKVKGIGEKTVKKIEKYIIAK